MKNETEKATAGEVGEIWLKTDSMMKGYYKNPETTTKVFNDGWYKTGDVTRLDRDGYFFIANQT